MGSSTVFLLMARRRVRGVTFRAWCFGNRVHRGPYHSVTHQRGGGASADHSRPNPRPISMMTGPDRCGNRVVFAAIGGQFPRPTVRFEVGQKAAVSSDDVTARGDRQPGNRAVLSSPLPRSQVLLPRCRRGLFPADRRAAEGRAPLGSSRSRATTVFGPLPVVRAGGTAVGLPADNVAGHGRIRHERAGPLGFLLPRHHRDQ